MTQENFSFQAEVNQLLHLMVHSLYSNKEIFLRELISNSSDALDKLRFEEVTNRQLLAGDKENGIYLTLLPESGRLVLEDTGIGMDRQELQTNLGTIANSGTRKYLEALSDQDKKDSNLIGQFGVGFYSVFMVAKAVTVESRSALPSETSWIWESTGDGTYSLREGNRQTRGTRIEIELKDDEKEFTDEWRVKEIVTKYSDYVTYPIFLVGAENATTRLNKTTPVWARSKRDNKPEDYKELYKQISRDFQEPLLWEHINAEGLLSFQAVVFVPEHAPFDLYTRDAYGLHLYVKRVSIAEKCKELLPEYLRFVSGVVETDNLPLNVSREILQQNSKLPAIKKQVVKKVLSSLANLATSEPEKYKNFYETFGAVLKEGFHFDRDNQETLSELVRFHSSKTGPTEWVSLSQYLERKVEGQKEIYFLSGSSFDAVSKSPHLEALLSRDIEVLFLTDPIDEWFVMDYPNHKDMALKSIAKGDLDLRDVGKESPEAEKASADASEVPAEDLASLLGALRTHLAADVKDVKVSKRLRESPCCLVTDEFGLSSQLERIMKATNKEFAGSKKILEVNPTHPLIRNLAQLHLKAQDSPLVADWADILFETALLAEGSPVKNPGDFAKKLTKVMEGATAQSGA